MGWDWEWMQHCVEIMKIFNQGKGLQELISTFQTRVLNLLRLARNRTESGIDELHSSRYSENLYNRVSILGVDMSDAVISDVKEFLLLMVNTEPAKVRYTSKTFSLELMFINAMKKNRSLTATVFYFGEILLGVEDRAVIAFFANQEPHHYKSY
jgi:hypothetical protein